MYLVLILILLSDFSKYMGEVLVGGNVFGLGVWSCCFIFVYFMGVRCKVFVVLIVGWVVVGFVFFIGRSGRFWWR